MNKWVKLGVIGVACFLMFLVLIIPASRAYPIAVDQFGKIAIGSLGDLKLYEISGTLWNGRADVATLGNVRLEPVIWDVSPWDLLFGSLTVEFSTKSGKNKLSGVINRSLFGTTKVSGLNADIRLDTLGESIRTYNSPFTQLVFGGKLRITDSMLTFDGTTISSANASVIWMEGAVKYQAGRSFKPVSLGSYKIDLQDHDEGVALKFADMGGVLKASGSGLLKPDGTYNFSANLSPQPAADKDLAASMQFIGVKQPDGSFLVQHNGTLSTAQTSSPAPNPPAE